MDLDSKRQRTKRTHRSKGEDGKKKGLHRKSPAYKDIKRSKKIFLAAVIVSVFSIFINVFKFYKSDVLAFIAKVLWLPMLIILFIIPIVCLLFIVRKKFNPKSYYLYALILCFLTIIFVAANS